MSARAAVNSFSAKSLAITSLILVLVIALFFIPEIISLQDSMLGKSVQKPRAAESIEAPSTTQVALTTSQPKGDMKGRSSLDRINALLKSGYLENPADGGKVDGDRTLPDVKIEGGGKPLEKLDEISWEKISSPQVRNLFQKAQKEAGVILKGLGEDRQQTRFALLSFVNGVSFILRANKTTMSPSEALNYLERLDLNVTTALLSENSDRADFLRWSKVSLGPIMENSKAERMKSSIQVPYNPKITLASVVIVRPARTEFRRYLLKRKRIPSYMNVGGFVMGKDTRKLVLLRNGRKVRTINMTKGVDPQGKRAFRFTFPRADGVFSIVGYDTTGLTARKNYQFLPRADRFPRDEGDIIYLPYRSVIDLTDFNLNEVDLRLDRLFRVSVDNAPQSDPNSPFERF